MPTDLIGQVLLNQFRVDRFVAAGGMATIYQVWDQMRSVPLAMKVLNPELAGDPAFINRFQREASSLQRLVHPNIVPFYGIYQADDLTFLLERYIDGPTLDEILRSRRGKPLSPAEAMVVFKALYTSVGYAHAQGIIHCDIKPGNVLVDQGGSVYLTDFGIARYMDSSATTSAAMGTPLYMAPEQVMGEPASRQTDVYALGIVLFELLTGRRPFRGDGNLPDEAGKGQIERVRWQQLNQAPPNPRKLNGQIGEGVTRVILKALEKRPDDRYATVQAMADELSWAIGARFESLPDRLRLDENGMVTGPFHPPDPVEVSPPGSPTWRPDQAEKPSLRTRRTITLLIIVGVLSLCALAAGGLIRAAGLGLLPFFGRTTPTPALIETLSPTLTGPAASGATATGEISPPTQPEATVPPAVEESLAGEVAIVRRVEGRDRLYLLDLGTQEHRALPEVPNVENSLSQAPQWSPDGARLAWMSRYAGKLHITAMELAEFEPYQLPAGEAYSSVSSPAWMEDGKRVSFWASSGSRYWLVTADGVTGEELDRVELPEYRNLFVWNPRNGLVAFARQRFDRYEVVMSGSANSADSPVESGGEEYAPAWSTDGEWLAFQSDAGRAAGENEIWVVRIDGSQLRQVTASPQGTWSRAPSWSPDGRWVAFVSNQAGSIGADYGELFAVEVDSGQVLQLTDTGGSVYDWRPAWRPR